MSRERRSGERKALTLWERATLYQRAATVAYELAKIDDVLRGTTPEWMKRASRKDQEMVVAVFALRNELGFELEAHLALNPMPGGAR